jgi:nucleoside phosphorylase
MAYTSQPQPLPISRDDFQIAIICALPEERDTVEALMTRDYKSEKREYGKARGDDNSYTLGEFGGRPIVLVTPRNMGTINVSHLASSMRHSFPNIALSLVVGIAGGAPFDRDMKLSEIHLGDVLVSTQVIGYDFGAEYGDRFESKTAIEDVLPRAPALVSNFLNILKSRRGNAFKRLLAETRQELADLPQFGEEYQRPAPDTDRVYESKHRHKHQAPNVCETCSICQEWYHTVCTEAIKASCEELGCQPQSIRKAREPTIHFGRIASGNGVMKSARRRDMLIQNEGCIGFEMEGAGTWEIYGTIVVKGVVDYADSHKSKKWRMHPAARASLCARALVEEIELPPVTASMYSPA